MAVIYGDDLANDLSGTAGADSIYGLGGSDTVHGVCQAGETYDVLFGGDGDDVYFYEQKGVSTSVAPTLKMDNFVKELDGEGEDVLNVVLSSNYYSILTAAGVECINVYGNTGYILGNAQDNEMHSFLSTASVTLMGRGGDDVLFGTQYDDTLDGGEGVDGMVGGKGDDLYEVDQSGDVVVEFGGQGYDIVEDTASLYRLGSNVEQLNLLGNFFQIGKGNASANIINSYGNFSRMIDAGGGADVISINGSADDIVNGGAGNDTLQAGLGGDVYRTFGNFGWDEITDIGGDDAIEFDVNESTLWFSRSGNDLNVSVIGTQNGVTVKNWYGDASAKIEEFYAGTGKMLTAAKVDSLVIAMSAFAPPTITSLPANVQMVLAPTLAAAWQ